MPLYAPGALVAQVSSILPRTPPQPFDIEQRRGIGGVLDVGEAGARRVSPPGGAGESNHGTQLPTWRPEEIPLDDGRTLVLEDS